MTLKECYIRMEGDYDGVLRRLGKEERVKRFLVRLLEDTSIQLLSESMEKSDAEEAFRAAHSLKGICMNLGLTPLGRSSAVLADALRDGSMTESSRTMYKDVVRDYDFTIECIRELN